MASMASQAPEPVPGVLRTRSFSRLEPQQSPEPISRAQRANTFQNGSAAPEIRVVLDKKKLDAFETSDAEDPVEPPRASVDLDDMPIELISMIDKYACPPPGI